MRTSSSSSVQSNDSDNDIIDKKRVLQDENRKRKIKKEKSKKKKDKGKKKEIKNRSIEKKKKEKKKDKKPKWGRYGVINNTDLHQRREEFMMWLSEVKCINIETLQQQDERRLFEEYVECYNTATLPSHKYYNFKIWYDKQQHRGRMKSQEIEMSVFDDEAQKKKEQLEQKNMLRNLRIKEQYQTLHECNELAAEMQEKQQLQELMRHQYLVGNHEAALKIHKQLEPRRPVIVSGDTSSQEY